MVLAYHVIFSTYGFWLPNDPRGSWSDFVYAWELFKYGGKATKVDTTQSLAHRPHNVSQRLETKEHLKYLPVVLSGIQAASVGRGFAIAAQCAGTKTFNRAAPPPLDADNGDKNGGEAARLNVPVYACAILPEHVHLVIGRSPLTIEHVISVFKAKASRQLSDDGIHPFQSEPKRPSVWSANCWKVFIDNEAQLETAIRYVENNPLKEGKPRQTWKFVQPNNNNNNGGGGAARLNTDKYTNACFS
jgi:REP element-mobilizing transposase RayT